jgi:hypothetical protein
MATYITYTYYTNTYLGVAITSTNFARLALRASSIIDRLTFQRAAAIVTAATDTATIDLIKMATCAVAEKFQDLELSGDQGGIKSESIGSNSVSYADNSYAMLSASAKLAEVAKIYLASTSLMFHGFNDGELAGSISEN